MLFLFVRFLYMINTCSIGQINVILRSIGSELTKLENIQKLYVLFDINWYTWSGITS